MIKCCWCVGSCEQIACFLCICSSKAPCWQMSTELLLTKGSFPLFLFLLFPSFWGRDPTANTSLLHYGWEKSPSLDPRRPAERSEEVMGHQSQGW